MFTKRKAESSVAPTYSRNTRTKTRAGMDTRLPFAVNGKTASFQDAASFTPTLDEEGADAYEAERMANIQRNANLMLSMGLTAAPAVRVPAPRPKPSRPTSLPVRRSMRRTDSDSSGSSALSSLSTTSSSGASSITVPQTPDSAREPSIADETNTSPMCIEEGDAYEAQRIATIKANADLLASLGFQAAERDLSEGPATRRTAVKTTPTTPKKTKWDDIPRRRSSRRSQTEDAALRASSPSASSSSPIKTRDEDFVVHDDGYSSSEEDRAFNSRVKGFAREGRTRGRQSHYAAAPLRRAARLGTRLHDPKVFGSIPGVSVGDWWAMRMHCSTSAVHAPTVSGISGNSVEGCFSICLSGGYEDDVDDGDRVLFTGSGGRDLKGTPENRKNLRTAPQSCDQTFSNTTNASLLASMKNGRPIRVVRGFKGKRPFSPPEGYVYSGLYTCTQAWSETGQAGFKVCRFELKRCEGQLELPMFRYGDEGEQEEEVEEVEGCSSQNSPTLRAATPITLSEEESEVEASICSEGVVPPAQAQMQTPQSSSVVIIDGSSDSETDFEEITSREFQSSQARPRRSARKAAKLSTTPKHTNERPSMPHERVSAAHDEGPDVIPDVSPSPAMQWFVVLESPNRIREADLFRGWQ